MSPNHALASLAPLASFALRFLPQTSNLPVTAAVMTACFCSRSRAAMRCLLAMKRSIFAIFSSRNNTILVCSSIGGMAIFKEPNFSFVKWAIVALLQIASNQPVDEMTNITYCKNFRFDPALLLTRCNAFCIIQGFERFAIIAALPPSPPSHTNKSPDFTPYFSISEGCPHISGNDSCSTRNHWT